MLMLQQKMWPNVGTRQRMNHRQEKGFLKSSVDVFNYYFFLKK